MRIGIVFYLMLKLFVSPIFAQIEKHVYEISALGKKIGEMRVSKEIKGNKVVYLNRTEMGVNLLFKKAKMLVTNEAHYENGQLINAYNRVYTNGEPHGSSDVEWIHNKYRISVDSEPQPSYDKPILFSGSRLYFEEPIGKTEAFSESSGVFMNIERIKGEKAYRITDPKNKRDMIRNYENGELVLTRIKHPFLTIYLRRKNE